MAGDRSSWVFATKKLLTELQLAHIWESEATGPASAWQVLIREAIKAREIAAWDSGIEKKPKLRTYRTLKTAFGREDYLALPPQQRSIIAVMRSGTNSLRIETGRWKREAVEDRICVLCGTAEVEDENHLITACAMYYDLRRRMYETVQEKTGWSFRLMEDDQRWLLEASIGRAVGNRESRLEIYFLSALFIGAALKRRTDLLKHVQEK